MNKSLALKLNKSIVEVTRPKV